MGLILSINNCTYCVHQLRRHETINSLFLEDDYTPLPQQIGQSYCSKIVYIVTDFYPLALPNASSPWDDAAPGRRLLRSTYCIPPQIISIVIVSNYGKQRTVEQAIIIKCACSVVEKEQFNLLRRTIIIIITMRDAFISQVHDVYMRQGWRTVLRGSARGRATDVRLLIRSSPRKVSFAQCYLTQVGDYRGGG